VHEAEGMLSLQLAMENWKNGYEKCFTDHHMDGVLSFLSLWPAIRGDGRFSL
jgi:hypothetical protein